MMTETNTANATPNNKAFIEFDLDVANTLIHLGYTIQGVGRHKEDRKKPVFFFKRENAIDEVSRGLNAKNRAQREAWRNSRNSEVRSESNEEKTIA